MEPWSTAILSLGARSPLKYVLETRSPRSLRGPHFKLFGNHFSRYCGSRSHHSYGTVMTQRKLNHFNFSRSLQHLQPTGGGGGSSIVKVPGDVPPARVCFFKPSSQAKGILFANFSPFSPRGISLPKNLVHLGQKSFCFQ